MMYKCIMVRVGESKETKKKEDIGTFINFADLGGIWNMHNWFREMEAPGTSVG